MKPKKDLAVTEKPSVNDTGTGQIDQSKQKKIEETENATMKETGKEGKAIIDDEEILKYVLYIFVIIGRSAMKYLYPTILIKMLRN